MTDDSGELERLRKELSYYKKKLDEVAGENINLDSGLSGLRHEIKQKRLGFKLLSELQQSIGAFKEIPSIFEMTIAAVNSTLGMDKSIVLVPTEKESCFRPDQWLGIQEGAAQHLATVTIEFPPEFRTGKGLLLVNRMTPKSPLIEEIQATFDLPFFVCLPVMLENAPLALLLSGRLREARPFYPPLDQGDVDTFQAIASLISSSLRNRRVAALEETDRLKTAFFANISHEFRTPITLTLGPIEEMLKGRYGEISADLRSQAQVIQRNQERLLALVNQILDLAKLEAGLMKLRASPAPNMNRIVEENVGQFRPLAEKRGLDLKLSLDPKVQGADLWIDREKFEKLISNLLLNAIKFTKKGYIEAQTEIGEGTFRLSVNDSGVGIKPDQLPFIFDRFRQADGSASREFAGTGLGLAWVKEIAELHGGNVNVFSQYKKGSSFRVSIPLGKSHLDPSSVVEFSEEELPALAGGRKIMIVLGGGVDGEAVEPLNQEAEAGFDRAKPTLLYAEDNADLRNYVRNLLSRDYNVFLAVDGQDGLEKVKEYRPDLLLTDHMMPRLSGQGLLLEVRKDPELRSIPVVILTARTGTEARVEGLEGGADDYINKPFHEPELLARIRNLLHARSQERELADLNRRLRAKVDEQMAELVRSGQLRQFLPGAVAESILKGDLGPRKSTSRMRVSVLFVDMVGSTSLVDSLEPEELSALVNEYLREMTAIAVSYRGTVVGFIGDSLMVVFGAPQACEDAEHAWAAVQTAAAMRKKAQGLSYQWRRRGLSRDVGIRIGLSTGFCTVGIFGSELLQTYTAQGITVNTAARLQSAADEGSILCSLPTYALVRDRVEASCRGKLDLRGIAYPVEAYEIIGLGCE